MRVPHRFGVDSTSVDSLSNPEKGGVNVGWCINAPQASILPAEEGYPPRYPCCFRVWTPSTTPFPLWYRQYGMCFTNEAIEELERRLFSFQFLRRKLELKQSRVILQMFHVILISNIAITNLFSLYRSVGTVFLFIHSSFWYFASCFVCLICIYIRAIVWQTNRATTTARWI
jgi:hypothetical protein